MVEPILAAIFASDGALWFAIGGAVATSSGALSTYPTPGLRANTLAAGPDGALWVSGLTGGIGRLTLNGEFTRFDIPAQSPGAMVTGPDGALWLCDGLTNKIIRVAP